MSLSPNTLAWLILSVGGTWHSRFHSYGLTHETEENRTALSWLFPIRLICKVTVRTLFSPFGIFVIHWTALGIPQRLSAEGDPRGHSHAPLMCFFSLFLFKALVKGRHTNDRAQTWWEQEGSCDMGSPWQPRETACPRHGNRAGEGI